MLETKTKKLRKAHDPTQISKSVTAIQESQKERIPREIPESLSPFVQNIISWSKKIPFWYCINGQNLGKNLKAVHRLLGTHLCQRWYKLNFEGASRGNSGEGSSGGGIIRNKDGWVIFVYLKFNGKLTKNQTKVIAPVLSFADPIISIR